MGGGDRIPGNSQASILGERTKKHCLKARWESEDQLLGLPLDTTWALHSHTHCTHTLIHVHTHVHTQRSYSKYLGWSYFRDKAGLLSHIFISMPSSRTASPAALPEEIPFVDHLYLNCPLGTSDSELRSSISSLSDDSCFFGVFLITQHWKLTLLAQAQWSRFNLRTREAEAEKSLRVESLPDDSET